MRQNILEKIETAGPGPDSRRQGHTAVALQGYLVFFAGCKLNGDCFNDVRILDTLLCNSGVETMKWKEPVPSCTSTEAYPVPRGGHTASVVGEKMYIFGGKCPSALGGEPSIPAMCIH